jgi:hypothetical protein
MDIPVRMRQIRTNNQNGESQIGLARQARSTSSTIEWTKRVGIDVACRFPGRTKT